MQDWDWSDVRTVCLREAARAGLRGADAEDAAQAAVIRAWRRAAECRDPGARNAWLRSIARHEASRIVGRSRRHELVAGSPGVPRHSAAAPDLDQHLDLRRGLAGIPRSDRELLLLRYGYDLTQLTISEITGTPPGTTAVRLTRARARLKQAMGSS